MFRERKGEKSIGNKFIQHTPTINKKKYKDD